MLHSLFAFGMIWLIACISMLVRWIAFNRMDSWALEISYAALIYNLLYGLWTSETVLEFYHNELFRCFVLLMSALAISGIHLHYAFVCKDKCRGYFQNAMLILKREAEQYGIYFREVGSNLSWA